MEAHSIEKFKSAVAKGIARSNLFHVELPRISNNNISSEDLNLFCSRVNLPSRQISTVDRVIGIVTEKVANTFITDDVNLTFHVTNDYNIKKYIESWMNLAVNNESYELGYKIGRNSTSGYGKEVVIHQLAKNAGSTGIKQINNNPANEQILNINTPLSIPGMNGLHRNDLKPVYTCILERAFPTSMGSIELSNDMDGLVEVSLSLTYTNWRSK